MKGKLKLLQRIQTQFETRQNNTSMHPYTCGNESNHSKLAAKIFNDDLETELLIFCPDCDYKQEIPKIFIPVGSDSTISFELYCVEVENIPYYNFLTDEEREIVHRRYEKYIAKQTGTEL